MFWTETAIAQHLDGRFYQLQQGPRGSITVVDLNVPEGGEARALPASRWTEQELAYLVELKRQRKTHDECAAALGRTNYAVMDKWQRRLEWAKRVDVPRPDRGLWLDDVARAVCDVFSVTKLDLISPRRAHHLIAARQVFYWLARNFTASSFPQIGAFCGGRDHSTIMYGVSKIDEQMDRYRTKVELCLFDLGLPLSTQEAA